MLKSPNTMTAGRNWPSRRPCNFKTPRLRPGSVNLFYGRTQFHGLWINPAILARLQQGQVLDDDPITGMKTAVTRVTDRSVVIESISPGGALGSEYDRADGMMIGVSFYSVLSKQQYTVKLQARQ